MAKKLGALAILLICTVAIVAGAKLVSYFYNNWQGGHKLVEAKQEVNLTNEVLGKTKANSQEYKYLKHYQTRLLYEIMNYKQFKQSNRLQAAIDDSRKARARLDALRKTSYQPQTTPVKRTQRKSTSRGGGGKSLDEILGTDQGMD